MSDNGPGSIEDPAAPRLRDRVAAVLEGAGNLFATRLEILREEAAEKGAYLIRGVGFFVVAAALAFMTAFLVTALLVALFTLLFGHLWAGILATLILFLTAAAAGAALGWKALSKVRPLDFPVTGDELRKDWEELKRATVGGEETAEPIVPVAAESARPLPMDDMEARFRAGSE